MSESGWAAGIGPNPGVHVSTMCTGVEEAPYETDIKSWLLRVIQSPVNYEPGSLVLLEVKVLIIHKLEGGGLQTS